MPEEEVLRTLREVLIAVDAALAHAFQRGWIDHDTDCRIYDDIYYRLHGDDAFLLHPPDRRAATTEDVTLRIPAVEKGEADGGG